MLGSIMAAIITIQVTRNSPASAGHGFIESPIGWGPVRIPDCVSGVASSTASNHPAAARTSSSPASRSLARDHRRSGGTPGTWPWAFAGVLIAARASPGQVRAACPSRLFRAAPVEREVLAGIAAAVPLEAVGVDVFRCLASPGYYLARTHLGAGRVVHLDTGASRGGGSRECFYRGRRPDRYLNTPAGEILVERRVDRREVQAADFQPGADCMTSPRATAAPDTYVPTLSWGDASQ